MRRKAMNSNHAKACIWLIEFLRDHPCKTRKEICEEWAKSKKHGNGVEMSERSFHRYETDETDWKLCELIARIQYATQQHFFDVIAEKYFDDMNNDVQFTGKRHQQKSVDGYNRLPDVFAKEDVMKCFGYDSENSMKTKIKRLISSHQIENITSGDNKGKYRKLNKLLV